MTALAESKTSESGPLNVMVVDDSAVIRGIVTRWLEADPDIRVVASCSDGQQAVANVRNKACDVVVLDIEMPVMDGLTALPKLLKELPTVQIVMSSTLTRRNADYSLRALALGAADYVAKPESLLGGNADEFRRELLAKVMALGQTRRARLRSAKISARAVPAKAAAEARSAIALRPMPDAPAGILAVGSSTGGPNALIEVMKILGPAIRIPVVITQHMPPTFTTLLAENIGRVCGKPCVEGRDGQPLEPGHVYVAPGGYHMEVVRRAKSLVTLALNTNPPENFCRPAVDPLYRSVAAAYGPRALALVLTGMGSDGREGARAVVAAGGTVVAQDEATSVVWGMPGAVAQAGLCSAVYPLSKIGKELIRFVGGDDRRAP